MEAGKVLQFGAATNLLSVAKELKAVIPGQIPMVWLLRIFQESIHPPENVGAMLHTLAQLRLCFAGSRRIVAEFAVASLFSSNKALVDQPSASDVNVRMVFRTSEKEQVDLAIRVPWVAKKELQDFRCDRICPHV
jgi:hypothetical protein